MQALAPPIRDTNQVFWLAAVPFVYLLFRFGEVLQMERGGYPRFSDLLAYSLALDLLTLGLWYCINAKMNLVPIGNYIADPLGIKRVHFWPAYAIGALFILSGAFLFVYYRHLRSKHARRLALSATLYAYLLAQGVCFLAGDLVAEHAFHQDITLLFYSFAMIHLIFPVAYFVFRPLIYPYLGRFWLKQRTANADSIAQEQGIAAHHGNLAAVKQAISTGADLNAHFEHEHNVADEFTLLILACFNRHEDAVDLLLSRNDVQVDKGSLRQHWTPLYAAAMRGNSVSVGKLIVRGADVHLKTEDEQSALLAATTFGHTQIVQQLMEAGARTSMLWMGVDAVDAAEALGRDSTVKAMVAYESHFQGHIREVEGCTCVASWPGIYCKSW
jgi:hypothetical protein